MNPTTWTEPHDGVAVGPTTTLEAAGCTIKLGLIWTDVDGVTVTIDTGGDPIPAAFAIVVADTITRLAQSQPPMLAQAA